MSSLRAYASPVAANSAIRIGVLNSKGGHRLERFFCVRNTWLALYGQAVWGAFGLTGSLGRHANLHGLLTRLASGERNLKPPKGHLAMTLRRTLTLVTPSRRARANLHRRLALASLKLNSSLSVRLSRYRAHMASAPRLEAKGVAK